MQRPSQRGSRGGRFSCQEGESRPRCRALWEQMVGPDARGVDNRRYRSRYSRASVPGTVAFSNPAERISVWRKAGCRTQILVAIYRDLIEPEAERLYRTRCSARSRSRLPFREARESRDIMVFVCGARGTRRSLVVWSRIAIRRHIRAGGTLERPQLKSYLLATDGGSTRGGFSGRIAGRGFCCWRKTPCPPRTTCGCWISECRPSRSTLWRW